MAGMVDWTFTVFDYYNDKLNKSFIKRRLNRLCSDHCDGSCSISRWLFIYHTAFLSLNRDLAFASVVMGTAATRSSV